jgi:uroporphyrinogen-III synthase
MPNRTTKKKVSDSDAEHVAELLSAGPLAGKRVLVTRAEKQAEGLSNALRAFGADVIEAPVIEVHPPDSYEALDRVLEDPIQYDWLVLTSVNGVDALFARLEHLGLTVDSLQHFKIAAIGPATELAIQDRGLIVDVVPPRYVAEEVVRMLRKLTKGERVLLVRAKVARDVIPDELRKAGADVEVVEAYQTTVPENAKARLQKIFRNSDLPDVITFTSSSTVKNFLSLIVGTDIPSKLSQVKFASIGPITSETMHEFGLPVHEEADEYTMEGLAQAVVRLCGQ